MFVFFVVEIMAHFIYAIVSNIVYYHCTSSHGLHISYCCIVQYNCCCVAHLACVYYIVHWLSAQWHRDSNVCYIYAGSNYPNKLYRRWRWKVSPSKSHNIIPNIWANHGNAKAEKSCRWLLLTWKFVLCI